MITLSSDFLSSTQSNKAFLLDIQADDLQEVDLAGLEADAGGSVASVTESIGLISASGP